MNPRQKEDAGGRSHGAFVEDGDVDAFDLFAEVVCFCLGRRHATTIPQGVSNLDGPSEHQKPGGPYLGWL